jgi:uncharacterized protein YdcH (DUF465 family)
MIDGNIFGDEYSPLRESPKFRRYMEEYKILDKRVDDLQRNRGTLSYEEVIELTKLKKLKLAVKDEMVLIEKRARTR